MINKRDSEAAWLEDRQVKVISLSRGQGNSLKKDVITSTLSWRGRVKAYHLRTMEIPKLITTVPA